MLLCPVLCLRALLPRHPVSGQGRALYSSAYSLQEEKTTKWERTGGQDLPSFPSYLVLPLARGRD